jgi:recombination associated protein RdgC
MGLLSSRNSITRYKVSGHLDGPIHETVYQGLKRHAFPKIEDEGSESIIGWTSFENPFSPDFEGYSFVFGGYMLFALRMDKKSIPPKLIQKHYALNLSKRMDNTGRHYLSGNEKKAIKEEVINTLARRIPAVPNIYDLVWDYDRASLWFFTNLKTMNEALESLFIKSFNLQLTRLFPYTTADLISELSENERDLLRNLGKNRSKE